MKIKPFLKWAGGKRWLAEHNDFSIPQFCGRYIEPFLGGGAMFFDTAPEAAILSDINKKLIDTYLAIREAPSEVSAALQEHQRVHGKDHYYRERDTAHVDPVKQAAQFLYLNRACWNGLYRENLKGQFNVPIGTKSTVFFPDDDFDKVSKALQRAQIRCCDFAETIESAQEGDLLFVDPPYTTAHNFNGFIKYNQKIFTWDDQVRLRDCVAEAAGRGAKVIVTNADHPSVADLYSGVGQQTSFQRASVISGKSAGRQMTTELIIRCNV